MSVQVLRVMLVDDHALVRSAMRQALTATDLEVVGEAAHRRGGPGAGAAAARRTSCCSISTCRGRAAPSVRELAPAAADTRRS